MSESLDHDGEPPLPDNLRETLAALDDLREMLGNLAATQVAT